jgi:tRNA pseudouridine32 synthase/23S rRNA pseudouridine746 synthase
VPEASPPIAILHEDDALVAVSKPAGEPVIPVRGGPAEACLRRRLERERGERLWVVHRIDREASGLVVFARSAAAHRAISLAFERRRVRKEYLAFVAGELRPPRGRIELALHAARRGKSRPAQPGEPGSRHSITDYQVLGCWRRGDAVVSLLDVRPQTGRHHQIRVHLRAAGVPLLFDPLYGRGRMPPQLDGAPCRRLALHAWRLELPVRWKGDERVMLEAPLAEELAELRAWLDSLWSGGDVTSSPDRG